MRRPLSFALWSPPTNASLGACSVSGFVNSKYFLGFGSFGFFTYSCQSELTEKLEEFLPAVNESCVGVCPHHPGEGGRSSPESGQPASQQCVLCVAASSACSRPNKGVVNPE